MSTITSGGGNLEPIVIPAGSPLVPSWAAEAVKRLNMLTSSVITSAQSGGGYGASAFAFSGSNAQLQLPAGFTGKIDLIKLTVNGSAGQITVQNGQITAATNPT